MSHNECRAREGSIALADPDDHIERHEHPDRERVDELADSIAEASAHIDSATRRLLADIREFDQLGGWAIQKATSCAHWLAWRIGVGINAARELVRTAKALGSLPLVDEALGEGRISYSKARAITRVATPELEPRLLELALCSTGAQMEKICRGYRNVVARDAAEGADESDGPADLPPDRYVRSRGTSDNMVIVTAKLLPDEAELVMKAIREAQLSARPGPGPEVENQGNDEDERGRESESACACESEGERQSEGDGVYDNDGESGRDVAHLAPEDVTAEISGPDDSEAAGAGRMESGNRRESMSRADALVCIADGFLAGGAARRRNGGERTQILIQIREERLEALAAEGVEDAEGAEAAEGVEATGAAATGTAATGTAESAAGGVEDGWRWRATFLDSGAWMGGETLMRLMCDAGIVVVRTDDEGNALDVGRRQRTIPPAVRRALMLRDQGRCCYPGCDNQVVDGHHVEHWAQGGVTKLSNTCSLCHRHHVDVHEGGIRIEADGKGAFRFFDRWGQEIVAAPLPPALRGPGHEVIRRDNHAAGVVIDAETSLPHWHGEPLDLVSTVNGLLWLQGRG